MPARARNVLSCMTSSSTLGSTQPKANRGTGFGRGVILTSHVHPELKLRITGIESPIPLFAFVPRTGTNLRRLMTHQKPKCASFRLLVDQ